MRMVFFGTPEFAVPSLAALLGDQGGHEVLAVVSQPDRPAGRGAKLHTPPTKELGQELGIAVLQPTKLRDGKLTEQLAALAPDIFVVVAYGRILPPDLLAVPRLGAFNVHASILPKLRGAAPIQWAIIRGETVTGVSIMRIEAGLDTGPIAAVASVDIAPNDTAGTLSVRLAALGAQLLVRTLPAIADGSATLREQDHAAATLAPPLARSDGHLDFSQGAAQVCARARGVDPWPGAFAVLAGESVKLFDPVVVPGSGRAGEFLGLAERGLVIACADAAVAFAQAQMPGRKRMAANAMLAGHPIVPGSRFA